MPTVSVSSITSGMAILAQHEQRAADQHDKHQYDHDALDNPPATALRRLPTHVPGFLGQIRVQVTLAGFSPSVICHAHRITTTHVRSGYARNIERQKCSASEQV